MKGRERWEGGETKEKGGEGVKMGRREGREKGGEGTNRNKNENPYQAMALHLTNHCHGEEGQADMPMCKPLISTHINQNTHTHTYTSTHTNTHTHTHTHPMLHTCPHPLTPPPLLLRRVPLFSFSSCISLSFLPRSLNNSCCLLDSSTTMATRGVTRWVTFT